ncbi:Acyl-CoA hydrolase [Pediococcus damnosus]|uniref:Acyl-CoA hydrolase n=1 Tax=Pediococcus damnosus TaxID=51663 RepID=A0A0R2HUI5_9LACO|nr:hotdog domain-containing protein [Pediococcus damnosus]AMV61064.1 Acyl-CoA hydrolase [Pediococcus damnosus]AMV63629.1 Acyl-CoA hydrolase [Pediococcus damnosus]AMV65424.1 Acyl-CoA hydrolase [Pediococcus damnosus]AMV66430.1 Acyl-CoA hydrolase [Pediococcus damnosus]AMV68732.1 Acyl-CoA hydrolase [Pediococcus damnosus]
MKTSETRYENKFLVTKKDLNYLGILFGGKTVAEMDLNFANAIRKLTNENAVTGSVDKVRFLRPGKLGDTITIVSTVSGTDERVAEVFGRAYNSSHELIAYAFFTYIVLKKDYRLPEVVPETDEEKQIAADFLKRQQRSLEDHELAKRWTEE